MIINRSDIVEKLKNVGLKATPQRIAILEAINEVREHPTADMIIAYIRDKYPSIAVGTVYNILETFVDKKLIKKVKTDKDIMRYDNMTEHHHHLYCKESEKIYDYQDPEIDKILMEYFNTKGIKNFKIEEITLQISGKYTKETNQ